jgi:hypothetical protein
MYFCRHLSNFSLWVVIKKSIWQHTCCTKMKVLAQKIRKIQMWKNYERFSYIFFTFVAKIFVLVTYLINFRPCITHQRESKVVSQNQHFTLFLDIYSNIFCHLWLVSLIANPRTNQERRLYKKLCSLILQSRKWYYSSSYLKSYQKTFIPNESPWKLNLGVWLVIRKRRIDYRNTESLKI